ncbi:POPLD domain-containing protein [Encephalitozoon hellem]|nr:POPLD domain-containing protein [Encephalitozoon hellem]
MAEKEIIPISFVEERAKEIQLIETAIESNRKKSMMFQRLPFYLRRRLRSHEKRIKKKKHMRKKDRHGLRTHVWYAKRFEMMKVWNTSIPLRRRMKSSKFIYKSQRTRGFVFDESYKDVIVYVRPNTEILGINFSLENVVQRIRHGNIVFEAIVSEKFLTVITPDLEEVESVISLEKHSRIECCLSLIQTDGLFLDEIDDAKRFAKILSYKKGGGIDEIILHECDGAIFVKSHSGSESGKVLLRRNMVMSFWQDVVNAGVIPVCVEELQRLALEGDYMVYPFDYATSKLYKDFEQSYMEPIKSKYERTPKSKKMEIDIGFMYIYTDVPAVFASFELEKGHADRCAFILNENDCIVGRVIRGGFCFTKGLCKGLCYVLCDVQEGDEFYSRNLNSSSFNQIKITKVFR